MKSVRRDGKNALRALALIAIVLTLGAVFIAGSVHGNTISSSGEKYYKIVKITNNGGTLDNFQIVITLDTATLIQEGKMRSDCGDLRVYDSDNSTQLPYWIKPGTENTDHTKIYVKVPTIPSGTKYIFIKYGDSSLTSQSNGETVFKYFNDFSMNDSANWEKEGGSLKFQNGYLDYDAGSSNWYAIMQKSYYFVNGIIEFDFSLPHIDKWTEFQALYRMSNIGGNKTCYEYVIFHPTTDNEIKVQSFVNGQENHDLAVKPIPTIKLNTWHSGKIVVDGNSIDYYLDGKQYIHYEGTQIQQGGHLGFRTKTEILVDNLRVRAVADPMPTAQIVNSMNDNNNESAGNNTGNNTGNSTGGSGFGNDAQGAYTFFRKHMLEIGLVVLLAIMVVAVWRRR